jgi:uncharacterized damage-inducible protein DinB
MAAWRNCLTEGKAAVALDAREQVALMARYHTWATRRLLDAVAGLNDKQYRKPCGLFFHSVHGTLNHLLVTDNLIWMRRFTGEPITSLPLDGEACADRVDLARQLDVAAGQWTSLVTAMDDERLAGDLAFTMTSGQARVLPVVTALLHVFNHGTHHRAQVTAALSAMGQEYPPLDMPLMVFAEQAGDDPVR